VSREVGSETTLWKTRDPGSVGERRPATPAAAEVVPLTRRETRRLETRARIYDAAIALFVARGFDGVTVDEISRSAGVAKRTFFVHFQTKGAVLAEYGRRVNGEIALRIEEANERETPAREMLRDLMGLLARRAQENGAIVTLLARQIFTQPSQLASATRQGRTLGDLLAGIVEQGQSRGHLRTDIDPRVVAMHLVGSFFTLSAAWAGPDSELDLRHATDQVLDVVLRGLENPAVSR
jgi:AcrR family transcriptional regulator